MLEKGQIWIYSQNPSGEFRVLLLKLIPERGGFWQPVTGHIEAGETIEAGSLRETFEETGLKPKTKIESLNYEFTFQGKWGVAHETVFAMETVDGCPEPILDPNEHTEFRWSSVEEASRLLVHESNRVALDKLKRFWSR